MLKAPAVPIARARLMPLISGCCRRFIFLPLDCCCEQRVKNADVPSIGKCLVVRRRKMTGDVRENVRNYRENFPDDRFLAEKMAGFSVSGCCLVLSPSPGSCTTKELSRKPQS